MEEIIAKIDTQEKIENIMEYFKEDLASLKQGKLYRVRMAEKFFVNGVVIEISDKDNLHYPGIIGFVAFYCNNFENKIAYISMLAVKGNVRCKGFGHKLLREAEIISLNQGMETIQLEVMKANTNAIKFYEKNNYILHETKEESFIYTKKLNLCADIGKIQD